jgi:HemY protein
MFRIILFLVLIALAAAGAAWVADQSGTVVLTWGTLHAERTIPEFALTLGLLLVAVIIAWSLLRALWRMPKQLRRARHARREARGRHAITQGLLAIGHGDSHAARTHADVARRLAAHDPLALLLHAQSAQLDGDRDGAHRAFRAMAERPDTRLLGLRGLFIEAQRADDAATAATIAEEALKQSPGATWAAQAVLGFRCAQGDWSAALAIVDSNLASGLIDKPTWRRQRGVLLTARALELETLDRDLSRESAMEAIKLAPTLVPAAVLAARYQSEAHQIRRAMKIIEAAWLAQPHPDLADAYAHVKLGDSARQRLVRVETLAAKAPGQIEGALAIARAAIDASEFSRARAALAPFVAEPSQRVAMLMAEIERTENGDTGRARAWTLRAVRAQHDPVWTADGYVSDRWRPVSPVTGRLDAFQWQAPLASLPSDKASTVEADFLRETVLAPPRIGTPDAATPAPIPVAETIAPADPEPDVPPKQDNAPAPPAEIVAPPAAAAPVAAPPVEAEPAVVAAEPEPAAPVITAPSPQPAAPQPLFRSRPDLAKTTAPVIPAVIPIVRPPDDPGVDDDNATDEFSGIGPTHRQAGGWRGFLARWGG